MGHSSGTAAVPVLLLYNLDPDWLPLEREEVVAEVERLAAALAAAGNPVTLRAVETRELAASLAGVDPDACVVFNWCDGLPGLPHSEAEVARGLETLQFTYTGSPPPVLALSWQKERVKQLLERAGVPTPPWRLFRSAHGNGWQRFPAIVKPAHEHASRGVGRESVVLDGEELSERVAHVLTQLGQPALVEEFIDGREFHVSVWGNGKLAVLPPAEMDFRALADIRDRLCSYDAKFTPSSRVFAAIELLLPAPLSPAERQQLEAVAVAAYAAVGCRDYARIDVRLKDGVFYVLDVNPNCDLSTDTSTALAASLEGGSFAEFLSQLVALAARRHPRLGAA
jgi:D-alanine-D-alanine ligase